MGAYLFVIALLIFFILNYDVGHKQRGKQQSQLIVLILLVLMSGLRYHIGGDSISYEADFKYEIPELSKLFSSNEMQSQPLWILLMSFCKTLFGSFVAFQFLHAIILNLLIFRFIKKTTNYVFTALLFTFCITWWNLSFEVLREALCVAIYINAILILKEKKYLAYLALGLVMIGLHWFAFLMVIITPFVMFVDKKIVYVSFIIGAIILFLFVDTQLFDLINLISADSITGDASKRIDSYLNQEGGQGRVTYNLIGLLFTFILYVVLPLITIHYNSEVKGDKYFSKILMLFILFAVLQTKLVIFTRFYNYLYIIMIVCIVNVLYEKKIKVTLLKLMFNLLTFIFMLNGCVSFYRPSSNEYRHNINYNCYHIPYKTIFQDPDPIRESL